jgi:hypothetical protein
VVNIDETNANFDFSPGTTLDGCGERTSGCATTGSSTRCTVLLGVTMDGDKLSSFFILQGGKRTPFLGQA